MKKHEIKKLGQKAIRNDFLTADEFNKHTKRFLKQKKQGADRTFKQYLLQEDVLTVQQINELQSPGSIERTEQETSGAHSSESTERNTHNQSTPGQPEELVNKSATSESNPSVQYGSTAGSDRKEKGDHLAEPVETREKTIGFGEAIKRPFQDIEQVIILSVISIFPIINFLANGYNLKVARGVWNQQEDLPEWENWGQLWVRGMKVFVINLLFYWIPLLLVLSLVYISVAGTTTSPGQSFLPALILMVPVTILTSVLLSPFAYSAALTYAKNYNFNEAMQLSEVFRGVYSSNFIGAMILGMVCIVTPSWVLLGYGAYQVTNFTLLADAY